MKMLNNALKAGLVTGFLSSSVLAIEVINKDDMSLDVYGQVRTYIGYGNVFNSQKNANGVTTNSVQNNNFFYGIQSNSRIGLRFKYQGFITNLELGALEPTRLSDTRNAPGLRQAWIGYNFEDAGVLLIGKTSALDVMSGFSNDVTSADSGTSGFGGYGTGLRRFQIQYKLPFGLAIGLSENEYINSGTKYLNKSSSDQTLTTPWRDTKDLQIPRITIAYETKSDDLLAKAALTYMIANNVHISNAANVTRKTHLQAGGIILGAKKKISDMYVAGILGYSINSDIYGGTFTSLLISDGMGSFSEGLRDNLGLDTNIQRANALAVFGYKIDNSLNIEAGAGYQASVTTKKVSNQRPFVNNYAFYLQSPYSFNKHFIITPQVGYYGVSSSIDGNKGNNGSILAGIQAKAIF